MTGSIDRGLGSSRGWCNKSRRCSAAGATDKPLSREIAVCVCVCVGVWVCGWVGVHKGHFAIYLLKGMSYRFLCDVCSSHWTMADSIRRAKFELNEVFKPVDTHLQGIKSYGEYATGSHGPNWLTTITIGILRNHLP